MVSMGPPPPGGSHSDRGTGPAVIMRPFDPLFPYFEPAGALVSMQIFPTWGQTGPIVTASPGPRSVWNPPQGGPVMTKFALCWLFRVCLPTWGCRSSQREHTVSSSRAHAVLSRLAGTTRHTSPPSVMPLLKRPSGAHVVRAKRARQDSSERTMSYTKFSLQDFIRETMQRSMVAVTRQDRPFLMASGCSGAGTPTFVAHALLGKKNVRELFGIEKATSKAHFFMTHAQPQHCFVDIRDVAASMSGPCYTHGGKVCDVMPERPDSLWVGFSCKGNSTQNPSRFATDNIKAGWLLLPCPRCSRLVFARSCTF